MAASQITEVRWSCKFLGVHTILKRIQAVLFTLQEISESHSNTQDTAAGLHHKMYSGDFIISLVFLNEVLSIMHSLNLAIQENSIKWTTIAGEILPIKQLPLEISIENVLTDSKLVCSMIGIYIDYEDPLFDRRCQSQVRGHELCQSLKPDAIPMIIRELDKRFSNTNLEILISIDALDASKLCYLDFNRLLPLFSRYESCFEFNLNFLRSELQRARIIIKSGHSLDLELYKNLNLLISISKTYQWVLLL